MSGKQQQLWNLGFWIVPQLGHVLAENPAMSPNCSCGNKHIETLQWPGNGVHAGWHPGPGTL